MHFLPSLPLLLSSPLLTSATPLTLLLPPNITLPSSVLDIHCSGSTYGYNPNIRDCEGAKERVVPDTRIWTLADRRSGFADAVPLPYRVMGDTGLCYVQPVLIGDHTSGTASLTMIRRAAEALILQCATSVDSQGGIATNIGGDNNIAVILGTYAQRVSCHAPFPSCGSCREILYDMPADQTPRVFGPSSDPTVTEVLPDSINAKDAECSVNLFSTGQWDVTSYYDIWQAVVAVYFVCARQRATGSVRGLGERGNIFLTMKKNGRIEGLGNSSGVASF